MTQDDNLRQMTLTIDAFAEAVHRLYNDSSSRFRIDYDNAVANVNPIPPGTPRSVSFNWQNANIDTLVSFFREWYAWNPSLSTGLEYIQKFSWLYYENESGLRFVTQGRGRWMTEYFVKVNAQKMDSSQSISLVRAWEEQLGSQMDDYIIPPGGYQNFNQFFAREIKPGKRPISYPDDPAVVVSSADAIVNMIDDDLSMDSTVRVKTQELKLNQLLDNSQYARKFVGGTAVSCILMPTVYHRYHSPVGGEVVESREDVGNVYFGIKDFPDLIHKGDVGYGYDYSVFEEFRRGYIIINTTNYGYVALIPVGLNTIASVVFKDKFKHIDSNRPVSIEKGEEVGYFQYGGSMNILLFESGVFPSLRIPQGQMVGRMNPKPQV